MHVALPQQAAPGEGVSGASKFALWMALIAAFSGWMFDGLEMGLYSQVTGPALRELVPEDSAPISATPEQAEAAKKARGSQIARYMSWSLALFLTGMAVGGIFFGRLGDRIGRVRTMIITVLMYAVFTGLNGLAHSWWYFATCRFLGAVGLGGEWGLGVALVMETWPAVSRPLLAGLLGAAANVGFLAAAGVGYLQVKLQWDWRPVLVVGFVPALLTMVIRIYVKEPERWVKSKGRGEKSRFSELFSPEFRRRTWVGMGMGAVSVLGLWGTVQFWGQEWVRNLVSPGNTGSPEANAASAALTLYMAVGAILGGLFGGLAGDWLGRRVSFVVLCMSSMVCVLVVYGTCTVFGAKLLWLVALAQFFQVALFGWLPLYLPELFPTRLRTTGEGFCFNVGRAVSAVAVVVGMGRLVGVFGSIPKAAMVTSLVYLFAILLAALGPETKGQDLPE